MVLWLLAPSVLAAPAAAQSAEDQAAAEALFQEGRRLMGEGSYAEACRRFEASLELDEALGTVLNLANCLEEEGRLASAWARFVEAATVASRQAASRRERVARARADALLPRLVRLRLAVADPLPAMEVEVGERPWPEASWGLAIPVDPGTVRIAAMADGYEPWSTDVVAVEEGATVDVEVPPLTPLPEPEPIVPEPEISAPPVASPVLPEGDGGAGLRTAGWIVSGVGAAALAAGGALGIVALTEWNGASCEPAAAGGVVCDTQADVDQARGAETPADASTGLFIGGGVVLGVGVVLLIVGATQGGGDEAAFRVIPVLSPDGVGVGVGGRF
jgi:hypothetical protein